MYTVRVPCIMAELSFKKKSCKYFEMNAERQANARAAEWTVQSHYVHVHTVLCFKVGASMHIIIR